VAEQRATTRIEVDSAVATARVEESRFWIRDLATGEDWQLTF